ncbi:MAG: hypothetical protein P8Y80_12690 [Acidobacteriota bacterium]
MDISSIDPSGIHDAKSLSKLEWILLVLGIALLASLPWTLNYWPSQDGPNHMATAHILGHYHDAGSPFARYLVLKPITTPTGYSMNPSNLQYVLLLFLQNFVSLSAAMKLLVSMTMVFLPLSLILFLHRTVPDRIRNIFLLLPLFSGWALSMGFVRYLLACIFGFLTLALASGSKGGRRTKCWDPTWLRLASAAAVFYLCAWSHPFIAVLFGAILMILEADALRQKKGWKNIAVIAVPGALLVILCMLLGTEQTSHIASKTEWWSPGDMLWGLVGYHVGFSFMEYFPRGVTLLVLYVLTFRGCRRIFQRSASFGTSLCYAVILLHLLYLALPAVWSDWYYCSARSLVIGAYLLPFVIVLPKCLERQPLTALAALLLTIAVFGLQYHQGTRFSSQIENILNISKSLPRGSKVLPICGFETDLPNPLHHAWAYLVPERDILTPYYSAAGKPGTGGSRVRALAYRPGVLDENGSLPWIDEEKVRSECSISFEQCQQTMDSLDSIFQKYDRILLILPSERLLAAAKPRLNLEREAGEMYLFRVKH